MIFLIASEISAQTISRNGTACFVYIFLSPLMSGGKKFKSNVTGCTLFVSSRWDIEAAMGKST